MIAKDLEINPLCLISSGSKRGDYIFATCGQEGVQLVLHETFKGKDHRKQACVLAHALIQASQDELYSRTDGQ